MEKQAAPVINYLAIITTFSWWKDIKGRHWVIASRQFSPEWDGDQLTFLPNTVSLLQLYATEPLVRPWSEVVEMIETGKLQKID